MRPQFALVFTPGKPADMLRWVRMAEDGGLERVGIADSPSLYRDTYVQMAYLLANTRRIHVGPRVANPVLRHPAVMASMFASLAEMSGGRVYLGIGTGHSSLLNVGMKPARLQLLRDYVLAVRSLLTTGQAEWEGRACRLTWWTGKSIPIYIAASGEKSLELAGEIGDGVVIGTGMTPEVIAHDLACIERGARKSSRTLADLHLQWLTAACVAEDAAQAGLEARAQMCSNAHAMFQHGVQGRFVPKELEARVQQLSDRYLVTEHARPGQSAHNANLVDELGLRDYLIDRFGIVGSPAQCVARIEELRRRGVNNFWMSVHTPEKERVIKILTEKVLPRFL